MLLAAVDLGSNSFRLEIGRVEGSLIERHGYWKETVRLAAGLGDDQRLSKRAIESACECLARMNERLRGMKGEHVRAVGTQTLRVARNLNEFLLEAQNALGYPIEVISGREEARLVFEGCMHTLPPSERRRLVVDIGGASTELIVGRGFAAEQAESFRIGCVNATLRYFRGGTIDRASFKRAQVAAGAEFEEGIAAFNRSQWDEAYGSSGTIGAVSEILRAEGWTDGTITSDGLLKLRQALLGAGEIKRIRLQGLKAERQEVIAGGVAVLSAVFETLGLTEMRTARGALRVGVLYDLLGRRESRDLRETTVERMQARFGVDRAQAQRVGALAAQFYDALAPKAADDLHKRLAWAAALHECGFAISHNDYHKHGAYLVQHSDLAGFSTTDQERIAALILGQRGNLKKVAAALEDNQRAGKILALRLAVIFCHARRAVEPPRWTLRSSRGAIELGVDADWLARHPLTQHLLEEEAAQWERVGIRFALRALA
ncbi:Ppx/GppA family phosphatase [Betaproteobacteria bacterium PRO7]|jgi:exopolyphosphatase/guanosine-5'-triphosphate,3'-diphosphate pyrophosphatase|nr:Ppx/GppA family phosphatase [Burkholderiaceae bacterium]MDL1859758.1 Ppx/GppA family phosphatase [Betaproteobacteria bacterium PRO7]